MRDVHLRLPNPGDASEMWRVRTEAIRDISDAFYPTAITALWADVDMPVDFCDAFTQIDAVVCERNAEIVAWGFANIAFSQIAALFVAPTRQRRGFGRLITEEFEKRARDRKLRHLELSATKNAVTFYERVGFLALEEREFEHPNGFTLPSVWMRKELGCS